MSGVAAGLTMEKRKTKDFSLLVFIWVICEYLLNHYVVFAINVLIFLFLLIRSRGRIKSFKGAWFFIVYFLFGFLNGLLHLANGTALFTDFFRDFLYWTNPFLILAFGANLSQTVRFNKLINSLNLGLCVAMVWKLGGTIMSMFRSGVSMEDSIVVPDFFFYLALLMNRDARQKVTKFRFAIYLNIALALLCFLLSFSRISIVVFAISCVIINFNKKTLFENVVKIISFLTLAVLILFTVSFLSPTFEATLSYFWKKILNSFTEISPSNVWNDVNVVTNWRGYEVYCASAEFSNGNLLEKLFGFGWGKSVDMGGYAYLVVSREDGLIPLLHNGYMTMLMKFGILGLVAFLGFFLDTFFLAVRSKNESCLYRRVLLVNVFCYLFITYLAMGIFTSSTPGIMILLWGYSAASIERMTRKTHSSKNAPKRGYAFKLAESRVKGACKL